MKTTTSVSSGAKQLHCNADPHETNNMARRAWELLTVLDGAQRPRWVQPPGALPLLVLRPVDAVQRLLAYGDGEDCGTARALGAACEALACCESKEHRVRSCKPP